MFEFYVAPPNRFSLDRWRIINAFIIIIIYNDTFHKIIYSEKHDFTMNTFALNKN